MSIYRLELRKTIRHEGTNIHGKYSLLVLSPGIPGNGWTWGVGGEEIQITPAIMEAPGRRVILRHGRHVFNEFEHIGILRAAGLEDVRVTLWNSDGWPPYDGGSLGLWNAVMPHVRRAGARKAHLLAPGEYALRGNFRRWIKYSPEVPQNFGRPATLRLTSYVHFDALREEGRASHEYPLSDLRELVRARTLGWPPALYWVSRTAENFAPLFGRKWPHHERILWLQEVHPKDLLEEAARHRLLDALGVLAFAVPKGTYLAGKFHSCMGNHATDLGLIKQIAAAENSAPLRHTAA